MRKVPCDDDDATPRGSNLGRLERRRRPSDYQRAASRTLVRHAASEIAKTPGDGREIGVQFARLFQCPQRLELLIMGLQQFGTTEI